MRSGKPSAKRWRDFAGVTFSLVQNIRGEVGFSQMQKCSRVIKVLARCICIRTPCGVPRFLERHQRLKSRSWQIQSTLIDERHTCHYNHARSSKRDEPRADPGR
jgi:hypothetical protein